jgi:hypothetical protein
MGTAIRQRWQRLQSVWRVLRGHQQGQSLIIITFAFIGILAFVGLAIDLGWVYVERVRVARAADAAALAGASELSLEGAAHRRALVYLQENGYDYTADGVRLVIDGQPVSEIDGVPLSNPPEENALTTIWIDTRHSRTDEEPNTADRIRVRVKQQVFMTFMQFIGFRHFPVEATAEAESINNLDVVIVYDKSGSMEYDTLCYGCWEASDEQYPSGSIYPLYWAITVTESADQCQQNCGDDDCDDGSCADGAYEGYGSNYEVNDCNYHRVGTDRYYIIIEAEEYSRLSVDYSDWGYTPYYTFWVVQRNDYNEYHDRDVNAMGRDDRNAYLSHHPYADYRSTSGLGVSCTWDDLNNGEKCRRGVPGGPYPTPRADYDFIAPRDGNYYIWIRGQGGNGDDTQHVFWGMDGSIMGREGGFSTGAYYDGARGDRWSWRRLSRGPNGDQGDWVYLSAGTHTLHLWAGGAGFDVDRIMITTDNETRSSYLPLTSTPQNNGRTDWACNPCDPRFGGRPGGAVVCDDDDPPNCVYRPDCTFGANPDQREDPIYDDEQPIRTALEAAKHFVGRLEPRFDQIGYVRYNERAEIRSELQCVRRLGASCSPQVITDTVLYELDITRAGGSTNIAQGMQRGIDVLSTGACNASDPHCGRPGAAHIMVLMTDGQANTYPNCYSQGGSCAQSCVHECCMEDLWVPDDPDEEEYPCANDCVMYYAQQAQNNAIVIYTISLGWSADREMMEAVADPTGGFHRWAPNPDQLNAIFDELYERIFLRLIR